MMPMKAGALRPPKVLLLVLLLLPPTNATVLLLPGEMVDVALVEAARDGVVGDALMLHALAG